MCIPHSHYTRRVQILRCIRKEELPCAADPAQAELRNKVATERGASEAVPAPCRWCWRGPWCAMGISHRGTGGRALFDCSTRPPAGSCARSARTRARAGSPPRCGSSTTALVAQFPANPKRPLPALVSRCCRRRRALKRHQNRQHLGCNPATINTTGTRHCTWNHQRCVGGL